MSMLTAVTIGLVLVVMIFSIGRCSTGLDWCVPTHAVLHDSGDAYRRPHGSELCEP